MPQVLLESLASSEQVAPEAHWIIIFWFKGDPGHRRKLSTPGRIIYPLSDERGFAVSGRSRDQRQFALQTVIQQGMQPLPWDELSGQTRWAELGKKQETLERRLAAEW